MTKPCVFCNDDLIATDVRRVVGPVTKVECRVFEPLDPVTPGHTLIVPVQHVPNATYSPRHAAGAMEVASWLAARYESANIITSCGAPATQTVFHLHVHVVPRTVGDGLALPWTGQKVSQSTA